jgi:hypothetical protein
VSDDEFMLWPSNRLAPWFVRWDDKRRAGARSAFAELLREYEADGIFALSGDAAGEVRERILEAVITSASFASGQKLVRQGAVEAGAINRDRDKMLKKLRHLVDEIEAEAEQSARAQEKWEIDPTVFDAAELGEVADKGRAFVDALGRLIEARSGALKADKENHLANDFMRRIRVLWADVTRQPVPKDGGVVLRCLVAAVWTEFDMPRDKSAKDENLDRWLARRFSETA